MIPPPSLWIDWLTHSAQYPEAVPLVLRHIVIPKAHQSPDCCTDQKKSEPHMSLPESTSVGILGLQNFHRPCQSNSSEAKTMPCLQGLGLN